MSRVRVGDQVQRHAFPGEPYRQPFQGEVVGANGRTVRVRDAAGVEWDADPTELVPAGTPWPGACHCSCCPIGAVQMGLF